MKCNSLANPSYLRDILKTTILTTVSFSIDDIGAGAAKIDHLCSKI